MKIRKLLSRGLVDNMKYSNTLTMLCDAIDHMFDLVRIDIAQLSHAHYREVSQGLMGRVAELENRLAMLEGRQAVETVTDSGGKNRPWIVERKMMTPIEYVKKVAKQAGIDWERVTMTWNKDQGVYSFLVQGITNEERTRVHTIAKENAPLWAHCELVDEQQEAEV